MSLVYASRALVWIMDGGWRIVGGLSIVDSMPLPLPLQPQTVAFEGEETVDPPEPERD